MDQSGGDGVANQEFVDALLLTTERETPGGRPWCRPSDAAALKKALVARGIALGGLVRQMVRLVRLMQKAGVRGYVGFAYSELPALDVRHFKQRLSQAAAAGRLRGIAEVGADGVRFTEAEMAARSGSTFSLDFVQMPKLVALLDIVHNMLGYPEVKVLLAGATDGSPQLAEHVAGGVEAAVLAWLAPRLQSLHHQRSCAAMRDYLMAVDRHAAHMIEDRVILAFWKDKGSQPEGPDGFRLFASAARHMLAYRHWLAAAAAAIALEQAGGLEATDGRAGAAAQQPGDDDWHNQLVSGFSDQIVEEWSSPLKELFSGPAAKVKWLTGTDREFLADVFEDAKTEATASGGRLFESRRPDGTFAATILRTVHFGGLQNQWKKGTVPASAQADGNGYAGVVARYADIAANLENVAASAALALLQAGRPAGLALMLDLAPDEAKAFLLPDGPAEPGDNVTRLPSASDPAATARLVSQALQPRTSKLGARLRAAASKVARAGLREQDRSDPEFVEALAAGAAAVLALRSDVVKLVSQFGASRSDECFASDRAIFLERFAAMYSQTG
jgi:hypothetical protein